MKEANLIDEMLMSGDEPDIEQIEYIIVFLLVLRYLNETSLENYPVY